MIRRIAWPVLALAIMLPFGCLEEARGEHELRAEEQIMMARLNRDPMVLIESWSRNPDGYVVVITNQGNKKERYIFKPDRPGERTLNVHHIDDTSQLESGIADDGEGKPAIWTGRTR